MSQETEKNKGFSDSVGGSEEEQLAKWLVKDPKELDSILVDVLKVNTRLLARRPDSMVTPEKIAAVYEMWEKALANNEINDATALPWMIRLGQRHEELVKRQNEEMGTKAARGQVRGKQTQTENIEEKLEELRNEIKREKEESAQLQRPAKENGERNGIKEKRTRRSEELPADHDSQREYVIEMVEQIESTELPLAPVGGIYLPGHHIELAQRLSSLLERVRFPDIKKEAYARLRLQHCYSIAAAIPGDVDTAKGYLYGAFQNPESRKWAIDPSQDFDLFFKEGVPGLKIGIAYGILQVASTVGIQIDSTDPKLYRTYDDNLTADQKDALLSKIYEYIGGDRSSAEKAFKFAQRIAKATLETSVWNKSLSGGDPLAEAIYLRQYRGSRLLKGQDRGPDFTIPRIEGFGTSFFRNAQTLEKVVIGSNPDGTPIESGVYLFKPDLNHNLKFLADKDPRTRYEKVILGRNRGELPGFDPKNPEINKLELFDVRSGDFRALKSTAYADWLGVYIPRVLSVKKLLLQSTWSPDDFSGDKVQDLVGPFGMADPESVLRLNPEFVLGVIQSILSNPPEALDTKWDSNSFRRLIGNLTHQSYDENGVASKAFVTPGQMEWVLKTLKSDAGINLWHNAALLGVGRTFRKKFFEINS